MEVAVPSQPPRALVLVNGRAAGRLISSQIYGGDGQQGHTRPEGPGILIATAWLKG